MPKTDIGAAIRLDAMRLFFLHSLTFSLQHVFNGDVLQRGPCIIKKSEKNEPACEVKGVSAAVSIGLRAGVTIQNLGAPFTFQHCK